MPQSAVWLLASICLAGCPALAGSLEDTLARLDKASAGFRGITANLHKVSYTALIKDSTEEYGKLTLLRVKQKDLRMLVEITKPEPRAVSFAGKKVQMYYPKVQTVQEYDLGKQSSLVDQFLLLGFGTPGSDLKRAYSIEYAGEENIGGVRADHLILTPKSQEALKAVARIEMWVSPEGTTIQQKILQPSRNYDLFQYSDLKLNPPINEESVKLKLPKGVKKETPQK